MSLNDLKGIGLTLQQGIVLTPADIRLFESECLQKVEGNSAVAEKYGEYLLGIRERIRKLEQNAELCPAHVMLLAIGLDLDDCSFDKVVANGSKWFRYVDIKQAGAPFIDRYFIALKLLIGMSPTEVMEEEAKRQLTLTGLWRCRGCGHEWNGAKEIICPNCESKDIKKLSITKRQKELTYNAAKKKVQRARRLTVVLSAYLIRGFVEEYKAKTIPSSRKWTKVVN